MDPVAQFNAEVEKTLTFLHNEFNSLHTGRANASLVEHIDVDAYGQKMQMKAVAGISIQDRTIVLQPWDKAMLQPIEKAIQHSNLDITPMNDGAVIRLNMPQMTEERRGELKKIVHNMGEEARVAVRQLRQKLLDGIKQEKDEDVRHTQEENLQKAVDAANGKIDDMRRHKEEEVMKV